VLFGLLALLWLLALLGLFALLGYLCYRGCVLRVTSLITATCVIGLTRVCFNSVIGISSSSDISNVRVVGQQKSIKVAV
jgi:hypothetical protein